MKKLSKITESVWDTIRKQSAGSTHRQEDAYIIDLINAFVERHKLKKGEYHINNDLSLDVYEDISVTKEDVIDGKLPFKFGVIKGNMWLTNNLQLTTLENAPREVTGDFAIYQNKFTDFTGGPEIVGGDFAANFNQSLRSLDGSPKKVGGNYSIVYCTSIRNIDGISPEIGGDLEITDGEKRKVWCDFSDVEYRKLSNIEGDILRR